MSDTPKTDAEADDARNFCLDYDCQGSNDNIAKPVVVSADFARQLERELAAAKSLAESNGKLAHDLGIKCRELRNQLNFLADHFPTEKQNKQP
jgi:hypothetical protein